MMVASFSQMSGEAAPCRHVMILSMPGVSQVWHDSGQYTGLSHVGLLRCHPSDRRGRGGGHSVKTKFDIRGSVIGVTNRRCRIRAMSSDTADMQST
jgi:hypothetical protein